MKRVFLALDSHGSVRSAIRKRMKRKKFAKHLKVVKKLKSADVVVTSTEDIKSLPESLPPSVQLLQLTDCGGGQRFQHARDIRISNASLLYDTPVRVASMIAIIDAGEQARHSTDKRMLQLGIVGLGNVGIDIMLHTAKHLIEQSSAVSRLKLLPLDSIVVNDFDVTSEKLRSVQQALSEVDVSIRPADFDELLATSDIVVLAVHRGPTADPLLGAREVDLLSAHSWVIDLSEKGVVDRSAFDAKDNGNPMPSYVRVAEIPRSELKRKIGSDLKMAPKLIAKFTGLNLRLFAKGRRIREVEIPDARPDD